MKSFHDILIHELPSRIFLIMAIIITLGVVIDSALNVSHVLVFFSLIILSILFFTIYVEAEYHRLGVSLLCIALGSIYLIASGPDFVWYRFGIYTLPFYLSGILFFTSWLLDRHPHLRHEH